MCPGRRQLRPPLRGGFQGETEEYVAEDSFLLLKLTTVCDDLRSVHYLGGAGGKPEMEQARDSSHETGGANTSSASSVGRDHSPAICVTAFRVGRMLEKGRKRI